MQIKRVVERLYSDFAMADRFDEYRGLLQRFASHGYRSLTVGGFWRTVADGTLTARDRVVVLYHDVDTDPSAVSSFMQAEADCGFVASYFFRLSTFAPQLALSVAKAGSEASYHYEELATLAKAEGLATKSELLARVQIARDQFAHNLSRLRRITGLDMKSVGAHGDYANRLLGVSNSSLLSPELRRELGIEVEVYDPPFLKEFGARFIDASYPKWWSPHDPNEAIRGSVKRICILTHPRHWRANRLANAKDDLWRLASAGKYICTRTLRRTRLAAVR
jgi:hypothetical protein